MSIISHNRRKIGLTSLLAGAMITGGCEGLERIAGEHGGLGVPEMLGYGLGVTGAYLIGYAKARKKYHNKLRSYTTRAEEKRYR